MIPSLRNSSVSSTKVYIGKIEADGYEDVCNVVNAILKGDKTLKVSVEICAMRGYQIVLGGNKINIKAESACVYDAFSTLMNQVEKDENGNTYILEFSASGAPKFPHRGFMFDESRHFFGKEEVKKFLDIMFRLKLNVFHWHLSDDQGFRLKLKDFPELLKSTTRTYSMIGSAKNRIREEKVHCGAYDKNDVNEILDYAHARGIEVIPELDIPGHMTAILAANPQFTCANEQLEVLGNYGIIKNVLCLGNDNAIKYVERLIDAICDLFKPKRFHLGFDEVKLDKLDECEKCQAKVKAMGLKDSKALKDKEREHFRDYVLAKGITPEFWNDGMSGPDEKCICHHWKTATASRTAKWINKGQKAVISNFLWLYTDYPYALIPFKKTYSFKPIFKGVKYPENVLGIEVPLWTEWVLDHDKIVFQSYYRMASAAEVAYNSENRLPYCEFMKELRQNEERIFGERVDIPEEMLNPKHRVKGIKRYLRDSYCEVDVWKEKTGR